MMLAIKREFMKVNGLNHRQCIFTLPFVSSIWQCLEKNVKRIYVSALIHIKIVNGRKMLTKLLSGGVYTVPSNKCPIFNFLSFLCHLTEFANSCNRFTLKLELGAGKVGK